MANNNWVSKRLKLVYDFGQTKSITQNSETKQNLLTVRLSYNKFAVYHLYFTIIIIIILSVSLLKPLLLLLFGLIGMA